MARFLVLLLSFPFFGHAETALRPSLDACVEYQAALMEENSDARRADILQSLCEYYAQSPERDDDALNALSSEFTKLTQLRLLNMDSDQGQDLSPQQEFELNLIADRFHQTISRSLTVNPVYRPSSLSVVEQ